MRFIIDFCNQVTSGPGLTAERDCARSLLIVRQHSRRMSISLDASKSLIVRSPGCGRPQPGFTIPSLGVRFADSTASDSVCGGEAGGLVPATRIGPFWRDTVIAVVSPAVTWAQGSLETNGTPALLVFALYCGTRAPVSRSPKSVRFSSA